MPRANRGGRGGYEPRARILSRAMRAWELSVAGRSQRDIARELDVSQSAVHKMVKRMAATLFRELAAETREHVARHVAQTDHVFRQQMSAWELSKTDQTRKRHQRVEYAAGATSPSGTKTITEASVVAREGDPRFIGHALRALGEKRAVLTLVGGTSLSEPEVPQDEALAALSNATLIVLQRLSRARMASPEWNSPFFASIPSEAVLSNEVGRRWQNGTMTAAEYRPVQEDADARHDAQDVSETTRQYRLQQRARRDHPEGDPVSRDASGSTLGRVGGGQLVEPEPPYDPHAMAKKLAAMMTVEELQTLVSVRKKTLTMSEAARDAFRGFTAEELFTLAEIKRKEASGEYTYGDDDPDDDA